MLFEQPTISFLETVLQLCMPRLIVDALANCAITIAVCTI